MSVSLGGQYQLSFSCPNAEAMFVGPHTLTSRIANCKQNQSNDEFANLLDFFNYEI